MSVKVREVTLEVLLTLGECVAFFLAFRYVLPLLF